MNALDVRSLSVTYGGVVALRDIDLVVATGEIVGLVGPNGSGKTSLLDAVSGFEPAGGTIRVCGEDVTRSRAHERARRGIGRTFQTLELFEDLTAGENVAARPQQALDALVAIDAGHLTECRVSELGVADRRLVALARALAAQPRLLLVDEIAAGLDDAAAARVTRCLRAAAGAGAGVVVVDHNFDLVVTAADRVVVLNHGAVLAEGSPSEVRANPAVIAAYLGTL